MSKKEQPRPIGVMVMIKEIKLNEMTAGGVLLPEVSRSKVFVCRGEVLAVGEGRWSDELGKYIPLSVEKGDHVLYIKHQGYNWVDPDGEEVSFVQSGQIMAVIPKV